MHIRLILAASALAVSTGASAITTTLRIPTTGTAFVFLDFTYSIDSPRVPDFFASTGTATVTQQATLGTTYTFDVGARNAAGADIAIGSAFNYVQFFERLTINPPANAQFAYSFANSSYLLQLFSSSGALISSATPTLTNTTLNNTIGQQIISASNIVDSHIKATMSWTGNNLANYAIPSIDPNCAAITCMGVAQSNNTSQLQLLVSTALPEPTTPILMGLGALALGLTLRRRRNGRSKG